jgi:hypothetical protein
MAHAHSEETDRHAYQRFAGRCLPGADAGDGAGTRLHDLFLSRQRGHHGDRHPRQQHDGQLPSAAGDGGLLYTLPALTPAPYPTATSSGINLTGATTATPYGPSFGSASGILRVVGSYKTTTSNNGNLGYLFDGANAPGQQLTTLVGNPSAFNTIAHSNFGNQVVGNWDTANLAPGNAFLYDIPSGTMTTINRPGAFSTTAYGVYGNRIAGGEPRAGAVTATS